MEPSWYPNLSEWKVDLRKSCSRFSGGSTFDYGGRSFDFFSDGIPRSIHRRPEDLPRRTQDVSGSYQDVILLRFERLYEYKLATKPHPGPILL